MPNMFAELARKATTLSALMEGRNKISTKDIIEQYPDGVTVIGFDVVSTLDNNGDINTYPIIEFAEDTTKFFYGGKAMNDITTSWLAHFEGDIDACSNALKATGGVKVKFTNARTRTGRNFTRVEIV